MASNNVKISPMNEADFQVSAEIMSQAFRSKMPFLDKFSSEEVAGFMLAGGLFDKEYLYDYYVAVIGSQVVGILHLETWQSKKDKPVPKKNLRYLFGKFGFFRVLISAFGLVFIDEKLTKDEMYIDFIAIDGEYRGQGIGTSLINYGESIARNTAGIHRYTLGVIHDNKRARHLYENLGFKVYETKSSRLVELLTGVRTSYRLEKLF